jgi:hypothetical protein
MNDTGTLGEATRNHAVACAARYFRRDLAGALDLYRRLIASHDTSASPE